MVTTTNNRFSYIAVFINSLVLLLSTDCAFAVNIRLNPNLTVEETFSDNIRLLDNNTDDELITSIRPNIRIVQEGARINSQIDYLLENNNYLNEDESNFLNTLDANANIEILENLFLDHLLLS